MKKLVMFTVVMLLMASTGVIADEGDVRTRVIEIKDGKVFVTDDGNVVKLGEGATDFVFDGGEMIKRGFLGVYLQDLTPDLRDYFGLPSDTGVLISSVTSGGPAAKAGIKAGDIVVAINGQIVSSSREVGEVIGDRQEGDLVSIEINRKGSTQKVNATLDVRDRPQFRIRRLPGDLEWIDEHSGEAVDSLRKYLESPDWKVRATRLGDCEDLRTKLQALEERLRELEKQLDKN